MKTNSSRILFLTLLGCSGFCSANQIAWYVAFSGESANPIQNIYALSPTDGTVLGNVLPDNLGLNELRNSVVGPNGNLYVTNAHASDSRVVEFGPINADNLTRNYMGNFITSDATNGLVHPYYLSFSPTTGDLYVSAQDTNVVLRFYGPQSSQAGIAQDLSPFLTQHYTTGIFAPGTFVAAYTARDPMTTTPVPPEQGGLTLTGSHSVRGFAFGPNALLYVSDEGANRVAVYDTNTGALVNTITGPEIINPVQIFYNPSDGFIYIACPGSAQIIKYDPHAQTYVTFIADKKHLKKVSGIAFGEDGNFYAGDRKKMCIHQYSANGTYIGKFGDTFTDAPEGLTPVYSNSRIYK